MSNNSLDSLLRAFPFSSIRHLTICTFQLSIAIICANTLPAKIAAAATSEDTPVEKAPHETAAIRLYRTNEERREAGIKRQITPWLTVSSLGEGEVQYNDFDVNEGKADDTGRENSASLQLGLVASPFELVTAEIIIEYDTSENEALIDEAFVSIEKDAWELSLGKQFTPFGAYFSSFVSGPLLEFGETQANQVATLTYGPSDDLEILLAMYRGNVRKQEENSGEWNWALSTEFWLNHDWSFGLSYQSDLADSDSRLLDGYNNRYIKQVAGISGFILWVGDLFEITLEALAATDSFKELDSDRNKPWAWNVELLHFRPGSNFEIALRIEGSGELEDEPKYQFGPAITWRAGKYSSLTLEYLHGEFEDTLATTESDIPYNHVDRLGAIFSIAF